jgi:predicted nucleic acid-binding protein
MADRRYFDAGVFVTPILKNRPAAILESCEAWLRRCAAGEVDGVTSWLTWDEVTWIAGRVVGHSYAPERARRAGELLLALPGVTFVDVDAVVAREAQRLLTATRWRPRDCLHAAAALIHAAGSLVTLDADYARRTRQVAGVGLRVVMLGST